MSKDSITKRRFKIAAAAMTLTLGAPFVGASSAGAQSCDFDLQSALTAAGYTNGWLQGGTSWQVPLTAPLVAGDYNFVVTASDDHTGDTPATVQTGEHFYLEFVDANGNAVGATPSTPDVPDTGSATDSTSLSGMTTLSDTAVAVRIIHDGAPFTDSVWPGCMGMEFIPPPTTTTTTTTTTSTTLPPTTTTTSTTSTTTTSTTTSSTTSSTTTTTEKPTTTTTAKPTTTTTAKPTTTTEEEVVVKAAAVTLPETGASSDSMATSGAAMIVLGAGLVMVARRNND